MISSLEQLLEWGIDNIYEYISNLNLQIINSVSSLGITPIDDKHRAGHYLGLRFPREVPDDFTQYLNKNNVHASVRGKYAVRVRGPCNAYLDTLYDFVSTVKSYFKQ